MEKQILPLAKASVSYIPGFLSEESASEHFQHFLNTIKWEQRDVKVFGKVYPQPRLTALYGTPEKTYRYAGLTLVPNKMAPKLAALQQKIEAYSGFQFNSVLLNLYRDGQDSNGWHSDDEASLGKQPKIASLSLGAPRSFHFRERNNHQNTFKVELHHGSLLLMGEGTQQYWHHKIPKTRKDVGQRINLTFRYLI
ncbi:alpha-ketoglutarate-dependent dioxygenase AlkB family protein [Altibacter sp. HG106]|uniref:alpha-ketoglutarate-dependent dioxygenase AlkB family protein n=1 Tax=Altibacter sp. HG106 TaxID=3023937 RepID=UPI002350EB80|nr:alpha-ketoglutarate-dependent dioxygenase AlkB [Altibacter sp. HG106]MDC7996315.1 alpha-ketoglutarate-dependent dioxygenase AlkB [Altibacter sp. HG106]